MARTRWFHTSAKYMWPSGPMDMPPGPRRNAAVASSPSWTLVPPSTVVTMPVAASYRLTLPEQSDHSTVPSGSAQSPTSQELQRVSGPGMPSSPKPGEPVPTSVSTTPVRPSTLRILKPYFSPTYRLSAAST